MVDSGLEIYLRRSDRIVHWEFNLKEKCTTFVRGAVRANNYCLPNLDVVIDGLSTNVVDWFLLQVNKLLQNSVECSLAEDHSVFSIFICYSIYFLKRTAPI